MPLYDRAWSSPGKFPEEYLSGLEDAAEKYRDKEYDRSLEQRANAIYYNHAYDLFNRAGVLARSCTSFKMLELAFQDGTKVVYATTNDKWRIVGQSKWRKSLNAEDFMSRYIKTGPL